MADREHPKKHDDTGSRKQPLSPQHEGIDPLTEGDKLFPRTDTKSDSTKLSKQNDEAERDTSADDKTAETVADQEELSARANTPDSQLPDEDKTSPTGKQKVTNAKDSEGDKLPQTAKPADPSVNDGNAEGKTDGKKASN